jgi:hypothetical protein
MPTSAHVGADRRVLCLLCLQFQLCGESNSIKYDVTPQFFDCGLQPYDRVTDKDFFINNSGKVCSAQCNGHEVFHGSTAQLQLALGACALVHVVLTAGPTPYAVLVVYGCFGLQVTFDFTIDLSRLSRPGIVEAHPSSGKVAAGEKARVRLKVS